jgi:hypothetical protein
MSLEADSTTTEGEIYTDDDMALAVAGKPLPLEIVV